MVPDDPLTLKLTSFELELYAKDETVEFETIEKSLFSGYNEADMLAAHEA